MRFPPALARSFAALVACAVLAGAPAPAAAAVPALVNYQGRLLRTDGTPEAGILPMTFAVYDAATGGTPLWTETQSVGFTDGFYSVLLGSVAALPATIVSAPARWLGVTVDAVELTPRQTIVSVFFALHAGDADTLGGAPAADFAAATHTHDGLDGSGLVALPAATEFVRPATDIPVPVNPGFVEVGGLVLALPAPARVYVSCAMTLRDVTTATTWVGLTITATDGVTTVTLGDNAYTADSATGFTSWSVSGILDLPAAGSWTIHPRLHRSGGGVDPIVHTFSTSAFQVSL